MQNAAPRRLAYLGTSLVLVALYFASAKLGLSLSTVQGNVTLLWPPTGVAIAALLLLGLRYWPAIALAAFLSTASTGAPLGFALGTAIGNPLEAVAAFYLLRHLLAFDTRLERIRDVLGLLLAAFLCTMVSATIGAASLYLNGMAPWAALGAIWRTWWIGDAMGALVVAPLLLAWGTHPRLDASPARVLEGAALLASVIIANQLVFGTWGDWLDIDAARHPLQYIVFPPLIWVAVRFGPRGATTVIALVVGISVWGTVHDHGPFVRGTLHENLFFMWSFMGVVAVQTCSSPLRSASAGGQNEP